MRYLILIVALISLVGCSTSYEVEVRSNTNWTGVFGGKAIDGVGDKVVDIEDDPGTCCSVKNLTAFGYVEIQIMASGGGLFGLIGATKDNEPVRSTASGGVVSDCVR